MRVSKQGCNRIIELDLKRAHGITLATDEIELYKNHLEKCPDCKKEAAALGAIAEEGNSGALPELDDLSKRRLIEDVIAKADEQLMFFNEEPLTLYTDHRRSPIATIALAATLAAASIVAALVWKPWAPVSPEETGEPIPLVQPDLRTLEGQFVLLSGEVDLKGKKAVLGDRLKSNDQIETKKGRAVVSLPTGIVVSLASNTQLSYQFEADSIFKVALDRGQIQVSVDPKQKRPGFSVVTRDGKVDVVGTVFSVGVGDEVEVRVLRGEVKIEEKSGRRRRVRAGGATTLSFARIWTLSKEEKETLWKEARAVEILDTTGETSVNISSTPSGASVIVDSVVLGITPVSASVRAGYREFSVALPGDRSKSELVDIAVGSEVTRAFNLYETKAEVPESEDLDMGSSLGGANNGDLSATELLKSAQELRAKRDWKGAARSYQRLVRRYPDSSEAGPGLVSLCDIQLRKLGKTKTALRCYQKYLAKSVKGPLAQEAMFGKANALKKLGNRESELETLNTFLSLFPSAIQADEVRQRIEHLRTHEIK